VSKLSVQPEIVEGAIKAAATTKTIVTAAITREHKIRTKISNNSGHRTRSIATATAQPTNT